MGSKWDSESAVVACLCALIKAGSSVWVAAVAVELPYLVVYRLARAFGLPIRQVKRVSPAESDKIAQLRLKGLAPMDIVCELSVGSSVVYRIGIELGLWHRNEHRRTAKATTRRCEYLQLRAHGLGRNDTAAVCGIHPRVAADIDKGACQVGNRAQAFRAPHGLDVALYNRFMQVIPYVDGREAVPVQIIPQERIDQRISLGYLSVEDREIIFDMKRCGAGVREVA